MASTTGEIHQHPGKPAIHPNPHGLLWSGIIPVAFWGKGRENGMWVRWWEEANSYPQERHEVSKTTCIPIKGCWREWEEGTGATSTSAPDGN